MINSAVIMGRLTFEPELRITPQGVSVMQLQVACERNYTPKGEERKTDFIDCTAWRQTAEFISKYFRKGDMIAVEGCIETNSFTDKQGNKRKSVGITVSNVSFCGGKSESRNNGNSNSRPSIDIGVSADNSDFEEIVDDDDDLPF